VVVCLSVCLSVNNFVTKTSNGLMNKFLNFGGDLDHGSVSGAGSGSVSRHW